MSRVHNTYRNQQRLREAFLHEPWANKDNAPRVVVTRNRVSLHVEGTAERPPKNRRQS